MGDQLANENQKLQWAVTELRVLNDIATTISSTQPVEEIIDQIVLKCIKHLQVEECAISLLKHDSTNDTFKTMVRRQDTSASQVPIKLDSRLTGWMLKNRSILLSNDIRNDDRFNFLDDHSYQFESILCVPLMVKGDLRGYLAVFNKKDSVPFSDQDRRLLSIIGSQSAQVIENARLYEEEKALLGLQEELRMARNIQLNLLPDTAPEIPGFEITATNLPAQSIGGDYYDYIALSGGRIGLCIGDITGKGMPAAMLMANLQATFRSMAMTADDCCECLRRTNKMLFRSTEATKFATFFYGILDPESNTLEFANGGHDAPLLFKNGQLPDVLNATGLLMGVMEDSSYTKTSVPVEPGNVLLLYSDGITEAMNPKNEEFGVDKLIELVRNNRKKSPAEIQDIILEEIKGHAGGASQSDDITLMIIKRNAP